MRFDELLPLILRERTVDCMVVGFCLVGHCDFLCRSVLATRLQRKYTTGQPGVKFRGTHRCTEERLHAPLLHPRRTGSAPKKVSMAGPTPGRICPDQRCIHDAQNLTPAQHCQERSGQPTPRTRPGRTAVPHSSVPQKRAVIVQVQGNASNRSRFWRPLPRHLTPPPTHRTL
jgi:hypothetical protein